jgi:hypothetical protein
MITGELKSQVDAIWDTMWSGGVSNPLSVIDQLTARGVIEADALYEPPFISLHAGGPDELFAGHEAVIEGIFDKLRRVKDSVLAMAG